MCPPVSGPLIVRSDWSRESRWNRTCRTTGRPTAI